MASPGKDEGGKSHISELEYSVFTADSCNADSRATLAMNVLKYGESSLLTVSEKQVNQGPEISSVVDAKAAMSCYAKSSIMKTNGGF